MKLRAKARKNCVVDTTTKSRRLAWRVAVASGMSALIPILSRRVKAPGDADRGGSLPRYYLLVQLDTVSGSGYTACFGGVDAAPGRGRLVTLPRHANRRVSSEEEQRMPYPSIEELIAKLEEKKR